MNKLFVVVYGSGWGFKMYPHSFPSREAAKDICDVIRNLGGNPLIREVNDNPQHGDGIFDDIEITRPDVGTLDKSK